MLKPLVDHPECLLETWGVQNYYKQRRIQDLHGGGGGAPKIKRACEHHEHKAQSPLYGRGLGPTLFFKDIV